MGDELESQLEFNQKGIAQRRNVDAIIELHQSDLDIFRETIDDLSKNLTSMKKDNFSLVSQS